MEDLGIKGLIQATEAATKRIAVGIPMTGLLRSEWVLARYSQIIPCNWSQTDCIQWIDQYSPTGYTVADARNIIATIAVDQEFEWLFFIDHDTILPPNTILKWNDRMLDGNIPIFSGLYFTKSVPAEPLVYRGRGNSYYKDWTLGEEVWVDGIPMGCTMIHGSILKVLYDESETYMVNSASGQITVRRIFETPAESFFDPEKLRWFNIVGTEDLRFCKRIMDNKIFEKAGWPEYEGKEFPFMIDTSVLCKHIDFAGIVYPARGEEQQFLPKKEESPPDLGISVSEEIKISEHL